MILEMALKAFIKTQECLNCGRKKNEDVDNVGI
jgi:hypothetical protein